MLKHVLLIATVLWPTVTLAQTEAKQSAKPGDHEQAIRAYYKEATAAELAGDLKRFVGLFAEVGSKLESDGPKKTQQTAQVEWIRVGSNHDHQALVYVKDTELLRSASKHWPWGIRLRVHHGVDCKSRDDARWAFLSRFAYMGAAFGELSPAHAIAAVDGREPPSPDEHTGQR